MMQVKFLIFIMTIMTAQLSQASCNYKISRYRFASYSNEVMILKPEMVSPTTKVRIHFHGYSQNADGSPYNKNFDITLKNGQPVESFEKTILAYGMERTVCESQQILVVPVSYYRCEDYRKSFSDQNALNHFIAELEIVLGRSIRDGELVISAHSGGGNLLTKLLKEADARIGRMILFEAFYTAPKNLFDWILKSENLQVDMVNVEKPNQAGPFRYSRELISLFQDMVYPYSQTEISIDDDAMRVEQISVLEKKFVIRNVYEKVHHLDHWGIVNALWLLPL